MYLILNYDPEMCKSANYVKAIAVTGEPYKVPTSWFFRLVNIILYFVSSSYQRCVGCVTNI